MNNLITPTVEAELYLVFALGSCIVFCICSSLHSKDTRLKFENMGLTVSSTTIKEEMRNHPRFREPSCNHSSELQKLTIEAATLTQKQEESLRQITTLTRANEDSAWEAKNWQARHNDLSGQNATLKREQEECQKQIALLLSMNAGLELDAEKCRCSYELLLRQSDWTNTQIEQLKSKNLELKQNNIHARQLQTENAELKRRSAISSQQLESKKTELRQKDVRIQQLELSSTALKRQHDAQLHQFNSELAKILEQFRTNNTELEELDVRLRQLESECAEFKDKNIQIQQLEYENAELKQNCVAHQNQHPANNHHGDLGIDLEALIRLSEVPDTTEAWYILKDMIDAELRTAQIASTDPEANVTVSATKSDVEEMKLRLELQEPLLRCTMRIRERLFEQCRERLGLGKANTSSILEGNIAAHDGDVVTDSAIISFLKHYSIHDPAQEASIRHMTSIFEKMYDLPHGDISFKSSMLYKELLDITGTVTAFSMNRSRKVNYFAADVKQLAALRGQFRAQMEQLRQDEPNDWLNLVDESPALNKIVEEMRLIKSDCMGRR